MAKARKIGIALGSGAAKGWAHIGVLKALEQLGVRPDIVVGTSMGALVGAAYACGSLDRLEKWARPMTWRDIISYMDISVKGGGLIHGEKLLEAIQAKTCDDIPIETMSKPFAAVATELRTGQEIWFRDGSLMQALRATIAMPGLFTPAKFDGEWLIDGALVNPVPVSVCRAMGASHVIAVNLNSVYVESSDSQQTVAELPEDLQATEPESASIWDTVSEQLMSGIADSKQAIFSRLAWGDDDVPGFYEVFGSSITIMQDRVARSRLAGDPPDVLLKPRVATINTMDFHKAEQAIAEGEASVYRMRSYIEELIQH